MNLFDACSGKTKRMNHVDRYSTFPVLRKENVAEHSWWVAFISLLIAEDLRARGKGADIHIDSLLRRALCHDLSEIISGDIIRSYKHTNPTVKAAMDEADAINMSELVAEYGESQDVILAAYTMAKDKRIEGQIVGFADLACVAFYCRSEWLLGNKEIEPILKDMYESWFYKYHEHDRLYRYADQMFPTRQWHDMLSFRHGELEPAWPGGIPIMPTRTEGAVSDHDWPSGEGTP